MAARTELSTLKALRKASGVGFGTVQRAKNGSGNITIQNLDLIARAFRRGAIDLLIEPEALYQPRAEEPKNDSLVTLADRRRNADHPAIAEITGLLTEMDDLGKGMALLSVRQIAEERGAAIKANGGA